MAQESSDLGFVAWSFEKVALNRYGNRDLAEEIHSKTSDCLLERYDSVASAIDWGIGDSQNVRSDILEACNWRRTVCGFGATRRIA